MEPVSDAFTDSHPQRIPPTACSLSSSQNRLVRSHGDRQRRDLGLRPVVPWIFSFSLFAVVVEFLSPPFL